MSLISRKVFVGALGVATVLSLVGTAAVLTASAAMTSSYNFTRNLTVGSQGADVTALQEYLSQDGFFTVAPTGYFGPITKKAVAAWQASVGLPSYGFFGPESRTAISAASVTVNTNPGCPAGSLFNSMTGASCATPVTTTVAGCTYGAAFSSTTGQPCTTTTSTVPGCTAGAAFSSTTGQSCTGTISPVSTIGTPGQIGSISLTKQSTYNGTTAYQGQAYNVAQYQLQATGASDMQVQYLTLSFDFRPWLYANSITLTDQNGAVIGQVNNLNANNFTQITVGSDYSLNVPVNFVVKAGQIDYVTVNMSFSANSNRTTGNIHIINAQIRAIDGTGVATTYNTNGAVGTEDFVITYQGDSAGSIIVTTDSSSPATGNVQLNTSSITSSVPLAVYDIKSQSAPSTLNSISIDINTNGVASPTALLQNPKMTINGTTYTANSYTASSTATNSATATFNNLTVNLPADQYVPIVFAADAAADTNNTLDGTIASTTLFVQKGNPNVEDQAYNTLTVNVAKFGSNPLTFTASSVNIPSLSTTYGNAINNSTTGSTTQQFSFIFSLTAGNNPIYLSNNAFTALSTSTNPSGITISSVNFSDDNTNGDGTNYFYLSPGQTKTFTAIYSASGLTSSSGTLQVNTINYGTQSSALSASALSSSNISNSLKAVLFH